MKPAVPMVLREGGHTLIAFRAGRRWLHAVAMGAPIRLVTLPLEARLEPMVLNGRPYPVRRAARLYLRSELEKTEGARRVLRALVKTNAGGGAAAHAMSAGDGRTDQAAPGRRLPLQERAP